MCKRLTQAEGAAHGHDKVADFQLVTVAQQGGDQVRRRYGQNRHVRLLVDRNFIRCNAPAVGKVDFNRANWGIADDVPVSEYVEFFFPFDDHSGAVLLNYMPARGIRPALRFDKHHRRADQLGHRFHNGRLGVEHGEMPLEFLPQFGLPFRR